MKNVYFFTGFPGFICNKLIREVWLSNPGEKIILLTLPQMLEKAEKEVERLVTDLNLHVGQVKVILGDITEKSIFQDKGDIILRLVSEVTHVYHLAAIYDLAVAKDIAYRVNVEGTRNLTNWVKNLPHLVRYTYFSTAYVAGKREGVLKENELIQPNQFKNYYEETKYEAELIVEEAKSVIPITIIRPGIVKGHTVTGETIKFDGPYFILHFFNRLRYLPIIPYLGNGEAEINLVPIDYILEATTYLSLHSVGVGKTYHLTDPKPHKVKEIYEMLLKELLNKKPKGKIPLSLAKIFLKSKQFQRLLKVEKEALDYFEWRGSFDCSVAQRDLKESGIQCPNFKEGLSAMVDFYRNNNQREEYQIKI